MAVLKKLAGVAEAATTSTQALLKRNVRSISASEASALPNEREDDSADAMYGAGWDAGGSEVKIGVWWDFENCSVPFGMDAHRVGVNIVSGLRCSGFKGPVSISGYGDMLQLSRNVQESLSATGIRLHHVPSGGKESESSDRVLLMDLILWTIDNPPPAHLFLISGDRDFSTALHKLRMRNYNVLLACPAGASISPALLGAASRVWYWNSLVRGDALTAVTSWSPDGPPPKPILPPLKSPPYSSLLDQDRSSNLKTNQDKIPYFDSATPFSCPPIPPPFSTVQHPVTQQSSDPGPPPPAAPYISPYSVSSPNFPSVCTATSPPPSSTKLSSRCEQTQVSSSSGTNLSAKSEQLQVSRISGTNQPPKSEQVQVSSMFGTKSSESRGSWQSLTKIFTKPERAQVCANTKQAESRGPGNIKPGKFEPKTSAADKPMKGETVQGLLDRLDLLLKSFPQGLWLGELQTHMALRKIQFDNDFFGHKKLIPYLLTLPRIARVERHLMKDNRTWSYILFSSSAPASDFKSSKRAGYPFDVLSQLSDLFRHYPRGIWLGDLNAQLVARNIRLDGNFYGHFKIVPFLLSLPEMVKIERRYVGDHWNYFFLWNQEGSRRLELEIHVDKRPVSEQKERGTTGMTRKEEIPMKQLATSTKADEAVLNKQPQPIFLERKDRIEASVSGDDSLETKSAAAPENNELIVHAEVSEKDLTPIVQMQEQYMTFSSRLAATSEHFVKFVTGIFRRVWSRGADERKEVLCIEQGTDLGSLKPTAKSPVKAVEEEGDSSARGDTKKSFSDEEYSSTQNLDATEEPETKHTSKRLRRRSTHSRNQLKKYATHEIVITDEATETKVVGETEHLLPVQHSVNGHGRNQELSEVASPSTHEVVPESEKRPGISVESLPGPEHVQVKYPEDKFAMELIEARKETEMQGEMAYLSTTQTEHSQNHDSGAQMDTAASEGKQEQPEEDIVKSDPKEALNADKVLELFERFGELQTAIIEQKFTAERCSTSSVKVLNLLEKSLATSDIEQPLEPMASTAIHFAGNKETCNATDLTSSSTNSPEPFEINKKVQHEAVVEDNARKQAVITVTSHETSSKKPRKTYKAVGKTSKSRESGTKKLAGTKGKESTANVPNEMNKLEKEDAKEADGRPQLFGTSSQIVGESRSPSDVVAKGVKAPTESHDLAETNSKTHFEESPVFDTIAESKRSKTKTKTRTKEMSDGNPVQVFVSNFCLNRLSGSALYQATSSENQGDSTPEAVKPKRRARRTGQVDADHSPPASEVAKSSSPARLNTVEISGMKTNPLKVKRTSIALLA